MHYDLHGGRRPATLSHMQANKADAASTRTSRRETEPRWPALLALLAIGGLDFLLPAPLRFGPDWLLAMVVSIMLVPTIIAHHTGRVGLNRVLGHLVLSTVTLSMVWSLTLLVTRLPSHRDTPQALFRAAAALWVANVLVFASWYWRLDAGGPHARDMRESHTEGAFLFPQMMVPDDEFRGWSPGFVDYLFLAFNTSTAFSPTDVPVLSRWAKLMMMVQASISLATVALIAARAGNIL
jgi:hypothetical protein